MEENEDMDRKRVISMLSAAALCVGMLGGTAVSAAADEGKHIDAALYWFGTSLDPATEWDG